MTTVTRYLGTCPVCYHQQRLRRMNPRTWPSKMLSEKLHLLPESELGLVLHGYRRPGVGYILGDCYGTGWPPWETTPNGNIAYVSYVLQPELHATQVYLSQLQAGEVTEFRIQPRRRAWGGEPKVIVIKQGDARRYEDNEWHPSFEEALQNAINRTMQKIGWLTQDIRERQQLIKDWKQQPLETEEEEQKKKQRMTDERRAVIDAAREAKRQKRAALDAKEKAREQEQLDLIQEYRDIFNQLAFQATDPAVQKQAVEHWKKMHKRKSKKGYLDFYERHLGIDEALVALKLAAPSRHTDGRYDYANDLGWDPGRS